MVEAESAYLQPETVITPDLIDDLIADSIIASSSQNFIHLIQELKGNQRETTLDVSDYFRDKFRDLVTGGCIYYSARTLYLIWENYRKLFKDAFLLSIKAPRGTFRKNLLWHTHAGLVAQDILGNWHYSSTANYFGHLAKSTHSRSVHYQANNLAQLLATFEKEEICEEKRSPLPSARQVHEARSRMDKRMPTAHQDKEETWYSVPMLVTLGNPPQTEVYQSTFEIHLPFSNTKRRDHEKWFQRL